MHSNESKACDEPLSMSRPPCLVSDQLVNIFIQEWMPLLPIIDPAKFLDTYADFNANEECTLEPNTIVQINLAFSIAATSADYIRQDTESFEQAWQDRLYVSYDDCSIEVLQSFLLAQLYFMVKPDHERLLRCWEKVIEILRNRRLLKSSTHRAEEYSLESIQFKTRRAAYVLDCFSAALTGRNRKLRTEELDWTLSAGSNAEFIPPRKTVTTLTPDINSSAAQVLFYVAKILAKVLDGLYTVDSQSDRTMSTVKSLEMELDTWYDGLPSYFRLPFLHDKPSASTVSSRSPLLVCSTVSIHSLYH